MNYYEILGVNENASQDDIKKAYKKLAMQHHPDRGGDNKKFQEISQAYDTISDPNKRSQYDAELNGMNNPFINIRTGTGFPNFEDVFGFHFGNGFAQHRQAPRNKDLTIRITVTFKQSYLGTQIVAKYRTPSGKNKEVTIDIPAGIQSGQTIRHPNLGDDSYSNLAPGNLNVQIMVETDPEWVRRNDDLCKIVQINSFEAILGCTKEIECLDDTIIPIKIRPGVNSGTEFSSRGRGFRNTSTGKLGNLIVVIEVVTPEITDQTLLKEIEKINAQINSPS
jgi:curved DNA-binding protein